MNGGGLYRSEANGGGEGVLGEEGCKPQMQCEAQEEFVGISHFSCLIRPVSHGSK